MSLRSYTQGNSGNREEICFVFPRCHSGRTGEHRPAEILVTRSRQHFLIQGAGIRS